MSVNAFNEIEFWRESLNRLNENGCRLESFDASDVYNFQLFCDASDVGYGGFIECMSRSVLGLCLVVGQKMKVKKVQRGES